MGVRPEVERNDDGVEHGFALSWAGRARVVPRHGVTRKYLVITRTIVVLLPAALENVHRAGAELVDSHSDFWKNSSDDAVMRHGGS